MGGNWVLHPHTPTQRIYTLPPHPRTEKRKGGTRETARTNRICRRFHLLYRQCAIGTGGQVTLSTQLVFAAIGLCVLVASPVRGAFRSSNNRYTTRKLARQYNIPGPVCFTSKIRPFRYYPSSSSPSTEARIQQRDGKEVRPSQSILLLFSWRCRLLEEAVE